MKRSFPNLWLTLIVLLGFALRITRLDFQPLWWDEGYSVFFATRDFATMLARTAIDIHPPLYYALMQVWMFFFGQEAVTLRVLSVVIGVATIPLLYALARKLSDHHIALIAALLLAIAPFHIYYSQEVRMYGLVTLLGLASIYCFVLLLPRKPGTRQTILPALLYITLTAAALYTQYYAAFILAAEMLIALGYVWREKKGLLRWRTFRECWDNPLFHWLGAWAAIGALYLPWVIYAGPKLYSYVTGKVTHEAYPPLDPITFLAQHFSTFATGHLTDLSWLAWASLLLITFAILGIKTISPTPPFSHSLSLPRSLVLAYLAVPIILGYVVNVVYPFHPVHGERLLLIAAPAFYFLAACGMAMIWRRRAWLGAIALSIIVIISAVSLYDFYTTPRYPNDDYRPLITEMQSVAQPGDLFLAIYPWQIGYLESYYHGAPLTIVEAPSDIWINQPDQMRRELESLTTQHPRVWIAALQTLGHLLEDQLDANLRPRDYNAIDTWYGTTRLELFAALDQPTARSQALTLPLSPRQWSMTAQNIVAGQDLLPIWFDWGAQPNSDYQYSLRLIDAQENVWAQEDRKIEAGIQRIGFIVPNGTPPGAYSLRMVMYSSADATSSAVILDQVKVVAPAQPNLVAFAHPISFDLGNGVRLVGFENAPTAQPGKPMPLTLVWQATHSLAQDWQVFIEMRDPFGKLMGTAQASPAFGMYPSSRWFTNELVRDPQTITPRGDTPDGNYTIYVGMIDPANQTRTSSVQIGAITLKGRIHYFGMPTPSQKTNVRYGEVARLIGYDVVNNSRLVLYWQALATSDISYKVFVHLTDENNIMRAQRDQIPGADAFPITSWVKGEYLIDGYDLTPPPGNFSISIGMYDPATNLRLTVFDENNNSVEDNSILPTRIIVP